jgi:hypothetical protein
MDEACCARNDLNKSTPMFLGIRKDFFFEKKKQKTFTNHNLQPPQYGRSNAVISKSFLRRPA